MISLSGIHKTFSPGTAEELKLFENMQFHARSGEFVCIIGSNGSGKTTLLNLISGNEQAESGGITLGNTDITRMPEHKRSSRIGRVYQDPSAGTAPLMTVAENLAIAENKGKPYGLARGLSPKRRAEYRRLLELPGMGLEDKLDCQVRTLSGGQRQALALLMCTMTPLDLLLLDEHTAALDPRSAQSVMELTARLASQKGLTVLMVTHNLRFALEYGGRLLMLRRGKAVLDVSGQQKKELTAAELLAVYNDIEL